MLKAPAGLVHTTQQLCRGACADPPFATRDVQQTVEWLVGKERDGFLEDMTPATQDDDDEAAAAEKAAANLGSRYLRSTLYIDPEVMNGARRR